MTKPSAMPATPPDDSSGTLFFHFHHDVFLLRRTAIGFSRANEKTGAEAPVLICLQASGLTRTRQRRHRRPACLSGTERLGDGCLQHAIFGKAVAAANCQRCLAVVTTNASTQREGLVLIHLRDVGDCRCRSDTAGQQFLHALQLANVDHRNRLHRRRRR